MIRHRVFTNAVLSASLCVAVAGCSGTADFVPGASNYTTPVSTPAVPSGSDTTAPAVSQASVNPTTLRFVGGPVRIEATISDNGRVASVWAEVSGPSPATVALAPTGNNTYAGVWTAPLNASEEELPQIHIVRICARDAAGNVGRSESFTVTVRAIPRPPKEEPF